VIGPGIAVDSSGQATVTGESTSAGFPTVNALPPPSGGYGTNSAFVTQFTAAGSTVNYSTLLGGSGTDYGSAVAVDPQGNVYVTGTTTSGNFPTANALSPNLGGTQDAFVAKLATATTGQVQFSTATYNANATDGTATITVDRIGGSSGAISVTVGTSNGSGTAGTDYAATTQTVSWADGDSTPKTVSIPLLLNNAAAGSTKTVNLTLSDPTGGAEIGSQATATLDIDENQTVPQPGQLEFSTTTYNANATAGSATITVDRTGGSSGAVSVTVSTSNGSGTAGTDYTATSQSVSWAAGDTTPKTVSIPLLLDNAAAGSTKTVNLSLSSATGGATLGSPSTATLDIDENETVAQPGQLAFSATTYNANATAGTATITIDRPGGSSGEVSVTVSTTNGSGTAGTDYTTTSQTVSWAAGDTAPKTVSIPLLLDSAAAGSTKTVNLSLSSATGGATLGSPSTATLDIDENETIAQPGQLAFSATTYNANATAGTASITIDRTGGSSGAVSVIVSTSNGTGGAGTDYTTTSQTVSWANGDTAPKTVSIPLLVDQAADGTTKTVSLTLSSPTAGATLGTPSTATLDINENGTPVLGNALYLEGQAGNGSDTTFVINLYRNLLGRAPESAGEAFWINLIEKNTGSQSTSDPTRRDQVVADFLNSPEYKAHLVTGLYETLLHRAPETSGLQFWMSNLGSPGTPGDNTAGNGEESVLAGIVGSQEYYVLHGSTSTSWVAAVYEDLLGRAPDTSGAQLWMQQVTENPGSRDAVAQEILSSPEAEHKLLDTFYPAADPSIPAPGAPAGGPDALAEITGGGWEDLYFQGNFAAPGASDTFFDDLQDQTPWDSVIEQMLETPQYYNAAQKGVL
jgi:hypothetical protein